MPGLFKGPILIRSTVRSAFVQGVGQTPLINLKSLGCLDKPSDSERLDSRLHRLQSARPPRVSYSEIGWNVEVGIAPDEVLHRSAINDDI